MGPFKQILARSHTVWSHDSLSVAAKPFHIIPIGPMNDLMVAQQHLNAERVPSHEIFEHKKCYKLGVFRQILARSHTGLRQDSLSDATNSFHIISIGPMNDVMEAQQHLKSEVSHKP
jgi:hypothetical protein